VSVLSPASCLNGSIGEPAQNKGAGTKSPIRGIVAVMTIKAIIFFFYLTG